MIIFLSGKIFDKTKTNLNLLIVEINEEVRKMTLEEKDEFIQKFMEEIRKFQQENPDINIKIEIFPSN